MGMKIEDKVEVFRSYCVGFGHTPGTPLNKASFTMGSGRFFDLHTYDEVEQMVNELSMAFQLGELSPCQKSVAHQMREYGILAAFHAIASIESSEPSLQSCNCTNSYAYKGECVICGEPWLPSGGDAQ